ncbi:hypothetical protein SEA_IDYN_6 [Gordonia phage IDyn]|uniref:Uncharacterized protein n=2 Tax=Sukkupivirus TaxID=2948917 RepID=A0A5Q2WN05_9CAUD|nr:hypothetical protein KNU47_gp06 [Gordonia phage IDyn]YP_010104584.1 hypothetical protein KNU78_gp05 [Gordonia phage Sukkupi]QAU07054.1 hypothetical protein SEA_BIPAUNETO_5 [Gordonia phage BiPauneto]QGH80721.1 hypothetical protein SEA_YNDEXA_5 [Gordonia phage Yndexa]QAY17354.1 hypothetical protein SEA_IDYN_6 [Gordonia phage IDyn]QGH79248.1 hypothetical protein SEA_SUKKUPI_5 [Gordonia phage Sukkupi]
MRPFAITSWVLTRLIDAAMRAVNPLPNMYPDPEESPDDE